METVPSEAEFPSECRRLATLSYFSLHLFSFSFSLDLKSRLSHSRDFIIAAMWRFAETNRKASFRRSC